MGIKSRWRHWRYERDHNRPRWLSQWLAGSGLAILVMAFLNISGREWLADHGYVFSWPLLATAAVAVGRAWSLVDHIRKRRGVKSKGLT